MFSRRTLPFWIGLIALSGMFLLGQETWPPPACVDNDGDGYGAPASTGCTHPDLDCDDSNPNVHPGAAEGPPEDPTCSDSLDNNCDSFVDSDDSGCSFYSAAWTARGAFGTVQFSGNTWLLGGSLGPGLLANDVWFSPDMVNWAMATAAAPWATRYWHMSTAYDGKIWVMGGGFVGTYAAYNDVWHSTDGANWTQATGAAAWSPRQGAGLVVFNGKLWLLGGVASEGGWVYKNDVWTSTNGVDWTRETNAAPWPARASSAVFVFAGKIWIVGGWNGNAALSDVWSSADGLIWNSATSTAPWGPRGMMPPAVYDNKMWIIGGFDGGTVKNDVWYSTDGVNWSQSPGAFPWSARYEHGVAISGGKMWLFGGGPGNWSYVNDIWSFSSVP